MSSSIVSAQVSATTLYLFIQKLSVYEPGLLKIIEELCGLYRNESVKEWIKLFQDFSLERRYNLHELQYPEEDFIIGVDALPVHDNNIIYIGQSIKNKTIHTHDEYLRTKFKTQLNQTNYQSQQPFTILDYFCWVKMCDRWGLYQHIHTHHDYSATRNEVMPFMNTDMFRHNFWNENERDKIKICDIIFWTINSASDLQKGNYIDTDSNNAIEIIYHVPVTLAQNSDTYPPIQTDENTGEEVYIMSHIIQGCVASALIKQTKHKQTTVSKMPIQTLFNSELHAQEYNKNYMSEYVKKHLDV